MVKKKPSRQKTDVKSLRGRVEELLRAKASDTPTMPTVDVQALVHELNVHQIELEIQNEERRQALVELTHSRDHYSDLYDFAPVGHMTLDKDGRILEANLTAATLLGGERKSLVGANISTWHDHDAQEDIYLHRQAVFSSDTKQNCEVNMHKADGTPLVVRLESVAFGAGHERQCRTTLIDVTTLKHRWQRLQESEQRYRRLTELVTDSIYSVRVKHGRAMETIHGANCEVVTGYTPDEFSANPMLSIEMVPEEDREIVEQQAARILSDRDAAAIEHRIRHKDGQICWVLNTVLPQQDEQGHLIAYDGLLRDITEYKRVEEAFNMRDRALTASINGVVITDSRQPDDPVVYCNAEYTRLTGYSFDEIIGHNCRFLQNDDHDQEGLEEIRAAIKEGRMGEAVIRNYRKDGSLFWNELKISPVHDADGQLTHYIGIQYDVTDRKRAEAELKMLNETLELRVAERTEALRESEEQLRAILNTAADAIITIDERGKINSVNDAGERMFGYTSDELTGQNVKLLMPYPYHEEHDSYLANYLKTGEARIIGIGREVVARRRDGSTFPIDLAVSEVDSHERLFTGIIRDITARKESEEALHREQELTENIIDTAPIIVLILDPEGRIVRFNPYFEKLAGWRLDEAQGRDWFDTFLLEDERQKVQQVFDISIRGERNRGYVNVVLTKDGCERKIQWYDATLADADGQLIGLLCTGLDITEHRMLQDEILKISAEEQRRIGLDLHDSTQQQLIGLGLLAQSLAMSLDELSRHNEEGVILERIGELRQRATKVQVGLKETAREVNQFARGLIPVEVDSQGLMSSLTELARSVSDVQDVQCTFVSEGTIEFPDNFTATHIYRIAQEAVNNALKHSRGERIEISLAEAENIITLKVLDNGIGIDGKREDGPGMGLRIMAYRADLIGATLNVGQAHHGGTEVICSVSR